jgi:hypothetical protein
MFRVVFAVAMASLFFASPLHAVEMNGTYDTTEPTNTDISNWDSGWGESDITGWDYVGTVNYASAVYLGNGWVLTAGHVDTGTFYLTSGPYAGTYTYDGVSESISNSEGTADLTLFQVADAPGLPPLSLATSDPSSFLYTSSGSPVVMIGYGGGSGKTWGHDTVTLANQYISVDGFSYLSNDFITSNASVSNGTATATNNSQLVSGDSGGGDFIYNTALGEWQLAGINEAIGSGSIGTYRHTWYLADDDADLPAGSKNVQDIDFSAMVQVDTYESQISAIVDAPEPPAWCLLSLALAGLVLGRRMLTPRS